MNDNKSYNIVLVLYTLLIFSIPVKAQVFDLSSTKHSSISINQEYPIVYKPSKLIIGNKTKFIIKAPVNSYVSLVTSEGNSGYPEYYGHKLRLGQTINAHEKIVKENGIVEIEIPLPLEKVLVGKILYFEVIVWKKIDLSDLKIAKIIDIDGRETNVNAVIIAEQPKKNFLPGIGTNIPGTDMTINKAMEILNATQKNTDGDNFQIFYQEQINYSNEPLMLRNLRVPEANQDK